MYRPLQNLRKKVKRVKSKASRATSFDASRYYANPGLYAKERLGITLTSQQLAGLEALIRPPYKVLIRAGHLVGKSTTVAVAISWIYDTRKKLFGIITAPKESQIKDIVWRELRKLRKRNGLGGFTGPTSLTLKDDDDHIFTGTTARDTEGFQGKHEANTFVFMDEASGIDPEFFQAAETMVSGEGYGQLIILNPLSTACQAYREERSGAYTVIAMSCLDHPNIEAELADQPPLYPSAVRLQRLIGWIKKWADPIDKEDAQLNQKAATPFTTFEFPKKDTRVGENVKNLLATQGYKVEYRGDIVEVGQHWRAGPEAESRILGLWPSSGVNSIWSELLFAKCRANHLKINPDWPIRIGCDIARYGDDMTEIAVRQGPCLLHIEEHSGWSLAQTTGRLKQLCVHFAGKDKKKIRVYIDETGGLGAGPVDFADGFNFVGVNVAENANNEDSYENLRTELWFDTRDMARLDIGLDFSRLPDEQAFELEQQLLAQKYKISPKTGRSIAVDKDETKKELGRSPDKADAVNLCYYQGVV